jgi:nucleoid-associated protein YgaU
VRVYAGEEFVGAAEAGKQGTWLVEAEKEIPVGNVTIRADASGQAAATPSAQVELPFVRYADGLVLEPAGTMVASADGAAADDHEGGLRARRFHRGDNLWRISRRKYGRGIRYEAIFAANSDLIRNPNLIYPGQAFILPERDRSWDTPTN